MPLAPPSHKRGVQTCRRRPLHKGQDMATPRSCVRQRLVDHRLFPITAHDHSRSVRLYPDAKPRQESVAGHD